MSNLKDFQQDYQSNNPIDFIVSACLLAINQTASNWAIPLAVIDGLPAAEFRLKDINETKVPSRFHLDSCASMHTGNLLVHQWLMTKYPEIVHCYEQFEDSNPFEPIMLEGALNVDSEK